MSAQAKEFLTKKVENRRFLWRLREVLAEISKKGQVLSPEDSSNTIQDIIRTNAAHMIEPQNAQAAGTGNPRLNRIRRLFDPKFGEKVIQRIG